MRTILQHAWAELEHDIQYKSVSDIPVDLNKRFSALAGLLEIADREFQTIQNDSAAVKDKVKADLLSDLTREGLSQRDEDNSTDSAESVRDLIAAGRLADAINLFDRNITRNPTSLTHYIGRAKARFLSGDVRNAIADLDTADKLSGTTYHTERLRSLIESGDTKQIASSYATSSQIAEDQKGISEALAAGDGIKAFEHYEALELVNYNRAFVLFGKAACCALERDTTGAASFLTPLEIRPGTIMAINLHAIRALIAILEHNAPEEHVAELRKALVQSPQYTIAASPLKALFAGFNVKGYPELDKLMEIQSLLANHLMQ